MIRKDITFTNFNNEEVTKTCFFNLSKADLIRMEVEVPGGFGEYLTRIAKAEDNQAIMAVVEKIILASYGVKSEDGMRFIKSQAILDDFAQTNAYSELLIGLCSDEDELAAFVSGIIPHNLKGDIAKIQAKQEIRKQRKDQKDRQEEQVRETMNQGWEEAYAAQTVDPTLEGPGSVVVETPQPRVLTMTEAQHMDPQELNHLIASGKAVFGK